MQYWNGTAWIGASGQVKSPAAPTGNQMNTVTFSSVSASKFRIVFTHASGAKSGVTEIAYGTASASTPTPSPTPTPTATPTQPPSQLSGGTASASYTFFMDSVAQVNNGVISYGDSPHDRWTAYESPNATDWVQTDFGGGVSASQAKLYLYSDGGGVKAPSAYDVQYWTGSAWTSAAGQVKSPTAPAGNQLNTVSFNAVTASKFRIVFTHASGSKSGATEIAYVGSGSATPTPTPTPTATPTATPTPTPGSYPNYQVSVISPAYGGTVNDTVTIKFYAPGMQNVWARSWHQPDTANPGANGYDSWFARVTPDASGYGEVVFPANQFPPRTDYRHSERLGYARRQPEFCAFGQLLPPAL
ncbi:galactose-binding domain-containing protein [Cohnella rhizosphaerae]|uniref:F5/8 type C domain-containing protein n=1 Tax=Cohnella rhizosphaerae TaxID=1457232 RepID=A0A9X4L239_9BACL|nr:hypothetical protein [Cohnella rhizosphaerae]MDG0814711.1 hypothetical protein [Cohnella rhizosphaerae]